MSRELLQLALYALKNIEALHLDSRQQKMPATTRVAEREMDRVVAPGNQMRAAIAALQAELETPELQPSAWMHPSDLANFVGAETHATAWSLEVCNVDTGERTIPLYATEPPTSNDDAK